LNRSEQALVILPPADAIGVGRASDAIAMGDRMTAERIVELARQFYLVDIALEAEEAVILARARARAEAAKRDLFEALRAMTRDERAAPPAGHSG